MEECNPLKSTEEFFDLTSTHPNPQSAITWKKIGKAYMQIFQENAPAFVNKGNFVLLNDNVKPRPAGKKYWISADLFD